MRFSVLAAALVLAPLAAAQAKRDEEFQKVVDAALARARPVLMEHLRIQHTGVLALLCLAAVHDKVPFDDKRLKKALHRLSRVRLNGTYDIALRLMVMSEVPEFYKREERAAQDTKRLLKRRLRGGFTYPQKFETWDLSNTQYAALGLRAAVALGQEVPREVWWDMARAVMGLQAEDGGFPYTKHYRRHKPYSSMTVAGIAVLRICRQQLGTEAPVGIDESVERAWKWMGGRAYEIGQIDTPSSYYFHYGLERAAILCDVDTVGDGIDWYRTGAEMLLGHQQRSGAWRNIFEIRPGALGGKGSPVDTSFAILFLRRSFQKVLDPVFTGGRGLALLTDNSSDDDVKRVVEQLVRHGLAVVPDLLKALRSRVLPQRRAAALALHRVAGREFGFHPGRSPEESREAIHAAEKWWMSEGRKKLAAQRASRK